MLWLCLLVFLVSYNAFKHHNLPFRVSKFTRLGSRATTSVVEDLTRPHPSPSQTVPQLRRMKRAPTKVDVSSFTAGQQFEAKVVSIMRFGVFVELIPNVNALVPRSNMSPGFYSRLSKAGKESKGESILVEITEISHGDGAITVKHCGDQRTDMSSLKDLNIVGQQFNATVVSKHNFGIFAKVDQFEVDGLIPNFKAPRQYVANLKVGQSITVKVEEVNPQDGKLVFSIPPSIHQLESFAKLPADQWTVAEVKSVTAFGIFVRPVGSDISGLIHRSRIPTALLTELRNRVSQESPQSLCQDQGGDHDSRSQQDLGNIFQVGDVVKVRVHGVDESALRVDFTMMPDRDEDEGFIPEFQLQQFESMPGAPIQPINYADESEEGDGIGFDAESTLVWWRGAAYKHSAEADSSPVDKECAVVEESRELRVGEWRRSFEETRRSEAIGSNSVALQNEIREIDEEIGDMASFTREMEIDPMGILNGPISTDASQPRKPFSLLSREDLSIFPSDWRTNLPVFDDAERKAALQMKLLKGGKSSDAEELVCLLTEIEKDISPNEKRGERL